MENKTKHALNNQMVGIVCNEGTGRQSHKAYFSYDYDTWIVNPLHTTDNSVINPDLRLLAADLCVNHPSKNRKEERGFEEAQNQMCC